MKDELEEIKQELHFLKNLWHDRVIYLENRIAALEKEYLNQAKKSTKSNHVIEEKFKQQQLDSYFEEDISLPKKEKPKSETSKTNKEIIQAHALVKPNAVKTLTPVVQDTDNSNAHNYHNEAQDQVIQQLVGPFAFIIEKTRTVYLNYKEQGKLKILFLTTAGILTLLAGFGFVLQYSFNFLNNMAKIAIGFTAGCLITTMGMVVIHKGKDFRDYGSSLVGLGVIINYLCIFFAVSYYELFSQWLGFSLISVNSIAAYFLALRYETKIVSVITFLGGAFSPFFLGLWGQSHFFHLSLLFLLCISALHLAKRVQWPTLLYLSFFTTAGIMEFYLYFFDMANVLFSIILFHGFSYVYIYAILFSKTSLKSTLNTKEILFLSGVISLLLFNLYLVTMPKSNTLLGILYAVNGLFFFLNGIFHKKTAVMRSTLLIAAAIFIGLAVPVLFDYALIALFWAQEGLGLVILGFLFNLSVVRKKGYLLCAVAILYALSYTPDIIDSWARTLINTGTLNLLVIGLVLIVLLFIMKKYRSTRQPYERGIRIIADNFVSLWGLAVFLLTALYWLPDFALNLAPLPMAALLFRGYKKNLYFTLFLGLSCYLLIFTQFGISAYEVESLHFGSQTIYGKTAIIEAFILLYLGQLFYEKLMPDSPLVKYMNKARILFYIYLPLMFLPHIFKYHHPYFPLAIWGAFIINFVLWEYLKIRVLLIELKIISIIAILISLSVNILTILTKTGYFLDQSFIATYSGLLVLFLLYIWKKDRSTDESGKDKIYDFFFDTAFFYSGLSVAVMSFYIFTDIIPVLEITAVYLLLVVAGQNILPPVKKWLTLYYRSSQLLLCLGIILNMTQALVGKEYDFFVNLIIHLAMLLALGWHTWFNQNLHLKLAGSDENKTAGLKTADLYLFHFLLTVVYLIIIKKITGLWLGPITTIVLVLQSIFIMFSSTILKLPKLMPLYVSGFILITVKIVLYDLRDFSLFQKILAFMLIGVVFLGAAYAMQRYLASKTKEN